MAVLLEDIVNLYETNSFAQTKIVPLLNFDRCVSDRIVGYVKNLDLVDSCLNFGIDSSCLNLTGVWTLENPSLYLNQTKEKKDENDRNIYFVPCAIDSDNVGWFIETGTICPSTFNFDRVETLIPLNIESKFNTEFIVNSGYKYLALYKVNSESIELEQVVTNFQYDCTTTFNRKYLINYSSQLPQKSIANYKLNLSLFAVTFYRLQNSHLIENSNRGFKNFNLDKTSYKFQEIIFSAINYFIEIIQLSYKSVNLPESRRGSINSEVFQFYDSNFLFNDLSDRFSEKNNLNYIEPECFEELCLENADNLLKIDRSVNNQAQGWLLLTFIELWQKDYFYNYLSKDSNKKDKFKNVLEILVSYVIKQYDYKNNYVYFGWTDSNLLEDSQVIYEQDTATNIICGLALYNYGLMFNNIEAVTVGYNLNQDINLKFKNDELKFFSRRSFLLQTENNLSEETFDINILIIFVFWCFKLDRVEQLSYAYKIPEVVELLNSIEDNTLEPILRKNPLLQILVSCYKPYFDYRDFFSYFNLPSKYLVDRLYVNNELKLTNWDNAVAKNFQETVFKQEIYYKKLIDYLPNFLKRKKINLLQNLLRAVAYNIILYNSRIIKLTVENDIYYFLNIEKTENRSQIIQQYLYDTDSLDENLLHSNSYLKKYLYILKRHNIKYYFLKNIDRILDFNNNSWWLMGNAPENFYPLIFINYPLNNKDNWYLKDDDKNYTELKFSNNFIAVQDLLFLDF